MATLLELRHRAVADMRRRAEHALSLPKAQLHEAERNQISDLAYALVALGNALGEGRGSQVPAHLEAYRLFDHIGDRALASTVAFNLGNHYNKRDELQETEIWYQHSLDMSGENDFTMRARCHENLGLVYLRKANVEVKVAECNTQIFHPFGSQLLSLEPAQAWDVRSDPNP